MSHIYVSMADALESNGFAVLAEVAEEVRAQDRKWGPQDWPDGTDPKQLWVFDGATEQMANALRAACDRHAQDGCVTWLDIAAEEMFEAFAEDDPTKLRAELIQVAAVITNWINAIDRRTTGSTPPDLHV